MYQNCFRKYLPVIIVLLLVLSGCAADNAAVDNGEASNQTGNGMAYREGVLDEELSDLLLEEQAVSEAYVMVTDDGVFASVEVEQDSSEEEILELVQRYADQIKEKYPDQKLKILVHQNGSLIIDLEM